MLAGGTDCAAEKLGILSGIRIRPGKRKMPKKTAYRGFDRGRHQQANHSKGGSTPDRRSWAGDGGKKGL